MRFTRRGALKGALVAFAAVTATRAVPAWADDQEAQPRFLMFHVEAGW